MIIYSEQCGNPSGVGRCPECGARIGALSYHVAAEGNVLSQYV